MAFLDLTEKDLDFLECYNNNFKFLQILNSIGDSITDEGKLQKKRLSKYLQDNLEEYMRLTN